MIAAKLKTLLLVAATLLATACESIPQCSPDCPSDEEILARAGAVRLTADETRAQVSGKTEGWTEGGAYYAADGELRVIWLKVLYQATWTVEDSGELCYQLPKWERRCQFYMQKDGDVYLLDEGRNVGIRPTYDGNRLKDLGRTLSNGPGKS